jgi:hypothetical protein
MLSNDHLRTVFGDAKCRGRVNTGGERLCDSLMVVVRDTTLHVVSSGAFGLEVDLSKISLDAEKENDPYGCDPAENMFYVPPDAITSSLETRLEVSP